MVITSTAGYTNNQVNRLFKHYLPHDENVKLFTSIPVNKLSDTLNVFSRKRIKKINENKSVRNEIIIPLFINGNHWTLLYIRHQASATKSPAIAYVDPKGEFFPKALQAQLYKIYPTAEIHLMRDSHQYVENNCGPRIVEIAKCLLISGNFPTKTENFDVYAVRKSHFQTLEQKPLAKTVPTSSLLVNTAAAHQTESLMLKPQIYYVFLDEELTKLTRRQPIGDPFQLFDVSRKEGGSLLIESLKEAKNIDRLTKEIRNQIAGKWCEDFIKLELQQVQDERDKLINSLSKATGQQLTEKTVLSFFKTQPEKRKKYNQSLRQFVILNLQITKLKSGQITIACCERYLSAKNFSPGGETLLLLSELLSKELLIWKKAAGSKLMIDLHHKNKVSGTKKAIHVLEDDNTLYQLLAHPIVEPNHRKELTPSLKKQLSEFEKLSLLKTKTKETKRKLKSIQSYLIQRVEDFNKAGNESANYEGALKHFHTASEISKIAYHDNIRSKHLFSAHILYNSANVYWDQGEHAEALELLKQALAMYKKFHGEKHPDIADTLQKLANVYLDQGEYAEALELLKQALAIFKKLHGEEHPSVTSTLSQIAIIYSSQGMHAKALEEFEKILAMEENLHREGHPDVANTLDSIGTLYRKQGRYVEALDHHKRALFMMKKFYGDVYPKIARISAVPAEAPSENHFSSTLENKNSPRGKSGSREPKSAYEFTRPSDFRSGKNPSEEAAARILSNIAIVLNSQGKYAEALKLHKQALILYKRLHGKEHPEVGDTLDSIGTVYREQGRYVEALDHHKRALFMIKIFYGDVHPKIARILGNIAIVHKIQGKYAEALKLHKQAFILYKKLHGKEHPEIARTLNNIANVNLNQGKYAESLEQYQQVLAVSEKFYGKEHPLIYVVLNNIACIYSLLGISEGALELYKQALAMAKKLHGKNHPSIASTLGNIASAYSDLGEYSVALKLYKQALAMEKKLHGKNHPSSASTLDSIARMYRDQGNRQKALSYQSQCVKAAAKMTPNHHARVSYEQRYAEGLVQAGLCDDDANKAVMHFQEARSILENVLVKDLALIKIHHGKIESYDLVAHNQLIDKLARIYHLLDASKKGAVLYFDRAMAFEKSFPNIALRYLKKASSIYKTLKKNDQASFAVLELRAKIYYQQKRLSTAIKALSKALTYDPVPEAKVTLAQWKKELKAKKELVDEDLWAQFEYALESTCELRELYLNDLEGEKKLSEEAKNRTTELFVKFRNILDQSYHRFVCECIYEKNKSFRAGSNIYFPIGKSEEALKKQLQQVEVYFPKQGSVSLRDYPICEEILFKHQPFTYFNEEKNKKGGLWKKSWLDKVSSIANDSKHVHMTPQYLKKELVKSFGTIHLQKLKIQIEYMETGFSAWTFVPYLGGLLSDQEKIALSRKIYNTLKSPNIGVIGKKKGRYHIMDPIVLQIIKTPKHQKEKIQGLRIALEGKIRKFLPNIGDYHISTITSVIIRRAFQQTHLEHEPDAIMNIETLLDNALRGTSEILETLCAARKQKIYLPKKPVVAPNLTPQKKDLEVKTLQKRLSSMTYKRLLDVQTTHATLKALTSLLYQKGQRGIEQTSNLFLQTAEKLKENYPYVSMIYYEKALIGFMRLSRCSKKVIAVGLTIKAFLTKQGLFEKGVHALRQALDHRYEVKTFLALQAERKGYDEKYSHIDKDSLSQMVHLESRLTALKYACFKSTFRPNDRHLQAQIHNKIAEIIIKIHHLLDQSFTRFANTLIFLPGEKKQVHFPCTGSEEALTNKLANGGLLDPNKRSLKDYPKLFNMLKASQPITCESWWAKVFALSVEAKHLRMQFNEAKDLLVKGKVEKSEDFYQIPFSPNRFFNWSFKEFGSHELSTKILQRLTDNCYLLRRNKNKGKQITGKINYKTSPKNLKDYAKALREGAPSMEVNKQRKRAFVQLKKSLSGIKLTDQNIERILDQLVYHLRRSMGDLAAQSGRRIYILKLLDEAVKETRAFVEAFFGAIKDAKIPKL